MPFIELKEGIYSVVFSPDGKKIVTMPGGGFWDVVSGEKLQTLEGHRQGVSSAAFSPDGRKILTARRDSARIWDAESGKELKNFSFRAY